MGRARRRDLGVFVTGRSAVRDLGSGGLLLLLVFGREFTLVSPFAWESMAFSLRLLSIEM